MFSILNGNRLKQGDGDEHLSRGDMYVFSEGRNVRLCALRSAGTGIYDLHVKAVLWQSQ